MHASFARQTHAFICSGFLLMKSNQCGMHVLNESTALAKAYISLASELRQDCGFAYPPNIDARALNARIQYKSPT
ncbi:hypothetical protein Y032_0093g2663 [Ancylostoma ceylanicum]|uniref:Uncharacterized protein n=1 Tax=Ancylostoma ceylanicum TaxID=53326 RepID=A0A016TKU0_9BILA|nr:hypothetical protein Y032_0093g2663 [Ancylostoma ceylanicum]